MNAILDEMAKPLFWFVSFFVGGVVSLAVNLATPMFDRRLRAIASWWRKRSPSRTQRWETIVAAIQSNPNTRDWYCRAELRARIRGVLYTVFSSFNLGMTLAVRGGLVSAEGFDALFIFVLGVAAIYSIGRAALFDLYANRYNDLVDEADRRAQSKWQA